ncbi:MAG TPA: hypothetical protein VHH36_07600, partial [Candidatus Thermoplasmatota archaeon]|nr:hypothetical protein [Candidatus Thermoplasmatota archaeon]
KPLMDRIPGNDSYNVKVEWFNAEANGERVTQRDWILHTGERFPNRVEVGVLNPLALYAVRPTPVGDDLLTIHATLNSPFGNYDVDASTLEIQVDGPTRPTKLSGPLVTQRNFEHNAHYAPVEATWSWPFREDGAQPGDYTVRVTAKNLQGSATVTKTASFTIPEAGRAVGRSDAGDVILASGPETAAQTPLPAGLLLAAGVVAALVLRRRA